MKEAPNADGVKCLCAAEGRVILPFLEKPPVVAYNYAAFLLGSVLASDPANPNFLFNSYIQLSSPSIYSASHPVAFVPAMGVDETPGIGAGRIEIVRPANAAEVERIVVDAIRNGQYARVVLDEFYLPERTAHNRVHYIHDNLIHGYCATCRTCFLAGYMGVKAQDGTAHRAIRFGLSACPLSSLGPAIFSRPSGPEPKFLQDQIVLFQPAGGPQPMDLPFIKIQLAAYLSSSHDPRPYAEKGYPGRATIPWPAITSTPAYGIGVYEPLINLALAAGGGGAGLDLRAFRLLWEHKACMARRVIALADHTASAPLRALHPGFAALEAGANQIRMESAFYRGNPRPESLQKIATLLRQLRDTEQGLLTRLVGEI